MKERNREAKLFAAVQYYDRPAAREPSLERSPKISSN